MSILDDLRKDEVVVKKVLDGDEITYNTDPLNPDTDNDNLLDGEG